MPDEAEFRDHRPPRVERLHVTIDIPDLLPAVALVAHILKRNGLGDQDLEKLGAEIEKLRRPTDKLKAATTAASPQP